MSVVRASARSPVFPYGCPRAGSADGVPGLAQRALDLGDPQVTEVEDGRGEDGVGAGVDGRREVREPAGATGGDDGDGDVGPHRLDHLGVVAVLRTVRVHRVEQDLTRAEFGGAVRPLHGVDAGAPAPAVGRHLEGPFGGPPGVDGQDKHLAPEAFGDLADELGACDGRGVDPDLVGPGAQQLVDVVGGADPAADGERDEDLLGGAAHHVVRRLTVTAGGGDVEERQLVGALGVVELGHLDGVARVAQVLEVDALDDAALVDDQGGVDEAGHDDHGGGGADVVEELLVGAAHLVDVPGVRDVHPGADDVLAADPDLLEGVEGDLEGGDGLLVRAARHDLPVDHGGAAGDEDEAGGELDGAGVAELLLPGGARGHAAYGVRHAATALRASSRVNASAYSALPTMAPSTPSGTSREIARRSASEETPPEATTGLSVAAQTSRRRARLGPCSVPSLAMSVTT